MRRSAGREGGWLRACPPTHAPRGWWVGGRVDSVQRGRETGGGVAGMG